VERAAASDERKTCEFQEGSPFLTYPLHDLEQFLPTTREIALRLFQYMRIYPDIPAAERVARDWCGGSALQAVVSGRKVYFFPPGIDKGTALRRAVERFGPERVIAAGDSVIDVPMLRQADLALIPDAELLPRLPRERTRVCGRDCRFPDFVLENVLRYAASLENT